MVGHLDTVIFGVALTLFQAKLIYQKVIITVRTSSSENKEVGNIKF